MNLLPFAVALGLLVISAVLIRRQIRAWHRADEESTSAEEHDFAWRQFRRRVQSSGLIGSISVAIVLAETLPWHIGQLVAWGAAILFVVAMMVLAVIDLIATRRHYTALIQRNLRDQLRCVNDLKPRPSPAKRKPR